MIRICKITRILSNYHKDQYNTKLLSSYLKQTTTPTLGPVTTETTTPEEADRAEESLAAEVAAVAETIAGTIQLIDIHLKEK